jgi:hypothetical protein
MVHDIPAKPKWTGLQLARIGPLVRFDLTHSENLSVRLTIEMRRHYEPTNQALSDEFITMCFEDQGLPEGGTLRRTGQSDSSVTSLA